jgi:hypothetical protein
MCALAIIEVLEQVFKCAFFLFWVWSYYSWNRPTEMFQNRPILVKYVVPVILIEIANVVCP